VPADRVDSFAQGSIPDGVDALAEGFGQLAEDKGQGPRVQVARDDEGRLPLLCRDRSARLGR
jgi:putative component of toxin-antitoxin plasmid stabilization module